MTDDNIISGINPNDEQEEKLLERLVDMMEEGHQLSNEEIALLATDKEAAKAYQQLALLHDVVEGKEKKAPQLSIHTRQPLSLLRRLWPIVAVAAALLVLAIIVWPHHQESPMIYVRIDKPEGIILKSNNCPDVDISAMNAQIPQASLTQQKGQLVLDYQTPSRQRIIVTDELAVSDTVYVASGKDFKLIMEDGTEVWMYANSRLIYPSQFVGGERRVFLEGEAYFRVSKDATRPFVVTTDRMEARVLGTELNVNSRTAHVALITGSVEVKPVGNGSSKLLVPGEAASLTDQNILNVTQEDMEPYIYWRDGYIYFDDAKLTDIAQQIGQWFNVDVKIMTDEKKNIRLHFLYSRSDSMKHVLDVLNNLGEFKVEYSNHTITIR